MNRRTTSRDASNNFADRILALDAAVRAVYEFRKFHLFSRTLRRIGERSLLARLMLFGRKRTPELYDIVRLSDFFVSDRPIDMAIRSHYLRHSRTFLLTATRLHVH